MAKLLGTIEGEVLHLDKAWETINELREFDGMRVEISIKEYKNTRRDRQNHYYWAVVVPCGVQAFLDNGIKLIGTKKKARNQFHDAMRIKFLMEDVEFGEEIFRLPTSTTDLSIQEFSDFMFLIIEMLREFYNTIVPPPREKF